MGSQVGAALKTQRLLLVVRPLWTTRFEIVSWTPRNVQTVAVVHSLSHPVSITVSLYNRLGPPLVSRCPVVVLIGVASLQFEMSQGERLRLPHS